jgi:hypothetical protein
VLKKVALALSTSQQKTAMAFPVAPRPGAVSRLLNEKVLLRALPVLSVSMPLDFNPLSGALPRISISESWAA